MTSNPFESPSAFYRVDLPSRSLTVDRASPRLAAVAELHNRYGADLLRRRNAHYAERLPDVPDLPTEDLILAAKLEHELDHVQRVASTSYGQLLNALAARRTRDWFAHVREADGDRVEFPVDLRSSPAGRSVLAADDAERVLQASEVFAASFSAKTIAAARAYLANLGGREGFRGDHEGDGLPTVPTRAGRCVVGAQCLLEQFAVSRERSLLAFGPGVDHVPTEYERSHLHILSSVVWRDVLELPQVASPPTAEGTAAGIPPGKRFPLEHPIAADLALWPPFSPEGWVGDPRWIDIHPGWRYLQILTLLKRSGRDFHAFASPADVTDEEFVEAQADWCRALGWVDPQTLRASWQDALRSASGKPAWSVGDDVSRWHADAEYLLTRQLHPAASVLTYPNTEGRARLWFQVLALVEDRRAQGRPSRMEVFALDTEHPWTAEGYTLPPSFALAKGIEALTSGFGGLGRRPPERVSTLLRAMGKELGADIARYARRHEGMRLDFDGYLTLEAEL